MRPLPLVGASFALMVLASATHAQSNEKPRRLHLGAGAEVMDHLGSECTQDVDVTGCQDGGTFFFPFTFSASFRLLPWVSLGGRFAAAGKSIGGVGSHAPRQISIWQLSLEPRAYPLGHPPVAPFVGFVFGYGSLRQTSAEVPEKTTHGSLLVGGALGADFSVTEWLALTTELRLARMDFAPPSAERVDGRSAFYLGATWLSLGLQLVALLPV
ncbi:MAG: outer membrane beta-barrel protein [Polyangiales bacterium]